MKKFLFTLCLAVALFSFTQVAVALNQVTLVGGYGPYQTGNGGEFTMSPTGTLSGVASAYVSGVTGNILQPGTFQTFCIEWNEHVSGNGTYDYVLNTKAINGGVGPAGDPISKGTAYLYYQFAKGTLSGYDYSGRSTAGSLQDAIWFLENEGGSENTYVQLVEGIFGSLAAAEADANGLYGVYALNLYDAGYVGDSNHLAQDVLVITPEPMTMILFGLGLVGLAVLTRKE